MIPGQSIVKAVTTKTMDGCNEYSFNLHAKKIPITITNGIMPIIGIHTNSLYKVNVISTKHTLFLIRNYVFYASEKGMNCVFHLSLYKLSF